MLKQQAKLVARLVYLVDITLVSAAFFLAFLVRDIAFPFFLPQSFPTGLYDLSEYLKVYPIVVLIWSALFFSHRSYHSHRTVPLKIETSEILRVVGGGTVLLATAA